jgi:hypothetical protein
MNIIFDSNLANQLSDKYTVLELDTVMQPKLTEPVTLWAIVEINNVIDLSAIDFFKQMHSELIKAYKSNRWEDAIRLASGLVGQFGGELDEFYKRVIDFSEESDKLNRTWDGILHTTPSDEITE